MHDLQQMNPLSGFNLGPQEIQQLQQQLQQQQQNLQNLQQMLLLQSTGQLSLPSNLQTILGLQNSGMFNSNIINQGLQNFAGQTMIMSHHLPTQAPNQMNGQNGTSNQQSHQNLVTNQKQSSQSDKNQLILDEILSKVTGSVKNVPIPTSVSSQTFLPRHNVPPSPPSQFTTIPNNLLNRDLNCGTIRKTSSHAKMNAGKLRQDFTTGNMDTNGDASLKGIGKLTNMSGTMAVTETKAAATLIPNFPLRSRSEPSPEEMTDLEELEQFAKMFKQRRIKLGE